VCAAGLLARRQLLPQLALHGAPDRRWHGAVKIGISRESICCSSRLCSGSRGRSVRHRRLLLLLPLLHLALLASRRKLLRQLALQAAPCCSGQAAVVSSSQAGIRCFLGRLCSLPLCPLLLLLLRLRLRWRQWRQ
jgi:hypothetical protein